MKTITKTYNLYTFQELSEAAKENAMQWYLDDPMRADLFYEYILYDLKENFPRSQLDVCFSLSSRQGDGLNIEGRLNLYDFIEFWTASEKEKRTIEKYIDVNDLWIYTFEKNNHYCYSCKFVDKEYIDDTISEFIDNLLSLQFKNIKKDIIRNFFYDMIDYFDDLDKHFEKYGYQYFYEPDENEIADACVANDWYFDIDGNFSREAI
jgi:hypothetical protein